MKIKGGDETKSGYIRYVPVMQADISHVLRAGMVYIIIWYVHVSRYVRGQNCLY